MDILKKSIQSNIVPEGKLKTKFYNIRKDLNTRLYSEIDLRGTDKKISWKYPQKIDKSVIGKDIKIDKGKYDNWDLEQVLELPLKSLL